MIGIAKIAQRKTKETQRKRWITRITRSYNESANTWNDLIKLNLSLNRFNKDT